MITSITWIDVTTLGAKADGVTDCTPAVALAVAAALARPQHMGATVIYFPPAGAYHLATPLTLPSTPQRITLYLDAPVSLDATMTIAGSYTLHGTEAKNTAFSYKGAAELGGHANPIIHVANGVGDLLLENLDIGYPTGVGIYLDHASTCKLKNVHIRGSASPGLKIFGGFGISIEGGGYSGTPGILYQSDLYTTGRITIKDAFIQGGIEIDNSGGGGIDGISIDGGLYENAAKAFLTLRTGANASGISGVEIHHVHMADSASPAPPIVDAHCPGAVGYIRNVIIANCFTDGPALTTGDTIYGLEVWSALDYAPGVIAQPDHFCFRGPNGVKDTRPKL
jgi:hypothetical protein